MYKNIQICAVQGLPYMGETFTCLHLQYHIQECMVVKLSIGTKLKELNIESAQLLINNGIEINTKPCT